MNCRTAKENTKKNQHIYTRQKHSPFYTFHFTHNKDSEKNISGLYKKNTKRKRSAHFPYIDTSVCGCTLESRFNQFYSSFFLNFFLNVSKCHNFDLFLFYVFFVVASSPFKTMNLAHISTLPSLKFINKMPYFFVCQKQQQQLRN